MAGGSGNTIGLTERDRIVPIMPMVHAHACWLLYTAGMAGDDCVMPGQVVAGVDLRLTSDAGSVLPWDGEAAGEIEVRGPWITASYYKDDDPQKFHDGWRRTFFFQAEDGIRDPLVTGVQTCALPI